jgi:hypothetical protein
VIVSGALSIWRGYYLYMISPLLSLCAQQASGVCFGCLDVLVCTCYSGYATLQHMGNVSATYARRPVAT